MCSQLHKQKILVVDDLDENIYVLNEILSPDYIVKVALNGEKALQIATSDAPPDLILLDIMMPVMDGYEVCRILKKNNTTKNIPVIFITAKEGLADEEKGFLMGGVDYITKPISFSTVKARVKTHLALYDSNRLLEKKVVERTEELKQSYQQLELSDKLASIGQLAAGVAHEINNPIGYIHANLDTLKNYLLNIFDYAQTLEMELLKNDSKQALVAELKDKLDVDYITDDINALVSESIEGLERVLIIIRDLKTLSHRDTGGWKESDIHQGIETTLNIVNNKIKYKAKVIKEYAELPLVECNISQINQVFMNLLVNASQAIEESGTVTIRTQHNNGFVIIAISDTGSGISAENIEHIFEPFYTTKAVGTGTGLGLSLSYDIIKKHAGTLTVDSKKGTGTTFTVKLPIKKPIEEEK
jgi:two-component system, NtrC family, sensor kinase